MEMSSITNRDDKIPSKTTDDEKCIKWISLRLVATSNLVMTEILWPFLFASTSFTLHQNASRDGAMKCIFVEIYRFDRWKRNVQSKLKIKLITADRDIKRGFFISFFLWQICMWLKVLNCLFGHLFSLSLFKRSCTWWHRSLIK